MFLHVEQMRCALTLMAVIGVSAKMVTEVMETRAQVQNISTFNKYLVKLPLVILCQMVLDKRIA